LHVPERYGAINVNHVYVCKQEDFEFIDGIFDLCRDLPGQVIRVKTWWLGLQQADQHPLVGVGYGNDPFRKMHTAEIEAEKDKGLVGKVLPALHNTFAMVLMGSGVPAIILFVWIFVRIVSTLTRQWQQSTAAETQGVLVAVAVVTVGFATRNLFD